jgi:hypothetical protein
MVATRRQQQRMPKRDTGGATIQLAIDLSGLGLWW